jgi:hypothetical protein
VNLRNWIIWRPVTHAPGHVLWEKEFPATKQKERWLELYTKHDKAWSKWIADARANQGGIYSFLTSVEQFLCLAS